MAGWVALVFLIGLALTGGPAGRVTRLLAVLALVVLGVGAGLFMRFYPDNEWAKALQMYIDLHKW